MTGGDVHSSGEGALRGHHTPAHRLSLKQLIIIVAFTIGLFAINHRHYSEQGIYRGYHVPLAERIVDGSGYSIEESGMLKPAFYPMWGYAGLISLLSLTHQREAALILLQLILAVHGIILMYGLFRLRFRWFHLAGLLPFVILMSVKWCDAIVSYLLVSFFCFAVNYWTSGRIRWLLLAGLALGGAANFRSEYIYLPGLIAVVALLPFYQTYRKRALLFSAGVMAIQLLCLLPWAYRYYENNGNVSLTGSNGGMVLFISLGQLPNNPWGIEHSDDDAFEYSRLHGGFSPTSPEGNKVLRDAFVGNVLAHPGWYAAKVLRNVSRAFLGGVYSGDFPLGKEKIRAISKLANVEGGYLRALPKMSLVEGIFVLYWFGLRLFYQIVFCPVLLFVLIRALWHKADEIVLSLLLPLIIYKLFLVGFIQYQPRHMVNIYLFVVGYALFVIDRHQGSFHPRVLIKRIWRS